MRADLQARLTGPNTGLVNSSTYPASAGQLADDKLCVKAWLYMKTFAPNINFNVPTIVGKAQGMQGLTPSNMMDLEIGGLATFQGYGNYTWPQLVAVARAAINGQGVLDAGLNKVLFTPDDYNDLINYALLTNAKVLNDAS